MKTFALSILFVVLASIASAQSVILGFGYSDFSAGNGEDSATFALEFQGAPIFGGKNVAGGLAASAVLDAEGDAFVGVGLYGTVDLGQAWFLEGSVMPGYYSDGTSENDLGGNLQFRTLLAVGRTLASGNRLSVAVTHKSNASLDDDNPGVNTLLLRWHRPF